MPAASWRALLAGKGREELPWTGGRVIRAYGRLWEIQGDLPPVQGWYTFETSGARTCTVLAPVEPALGRFIDRHGSHYGYVVGGRFVRVDARVDPDPDKLAQQTHVLHLAPETLERFRPVRVTNLDGTWIFLEECWFGTEVALLASDAYADRKLNLDGVKGVTPALDLAFRFASRERERAEELARERVAERERAEAMKRLGTAAGRRVAATANFDAAATEALRLSGSTFLDARPSHGGDMTVRFRFRGRAFECVVERATLRVVDSGICLEDHDTRQRGDKWLSLESLPGVIGQAIDEEVLVVYRHADREHVDAGGDDYEDFD